MPVPDYAKTAFEQLWIVDEPTFNVLVYPAVTDALFPLPGVVLPLALKTFTPSLERTQSAGVREQIPRKRQASPWTIPVYTKYGAAAGTPPSWGLLAKKGFGVQTVNAGVSVVYSFLNDVTEQSLSLWHWIDNMMFGHRGCVVNTIRRDLSGTDEGRITFTGFLLNTVFAGATTLNGAIDAIVTSVVVTDSTVFQIGPAATDRVRIQIDSEVLEITAINYATHTLTVLRAQAGSAAAAHANAAEAAPWKPGADTDPADLIAPHTIGEITLGALANLRGLSFTELIDNKLEPRMDEYAQGQATGYRRQTGAKREVTGELRAYARKIHQPLLTDPEREITRAATIRSGDTATARLTSSLPRLRFRSIDKVGDGAEFVIVGPYQAFESSAGNDELTWTLD